MSRSNRCTASRWRWKGGGDGETVAAAVDELDELADLVMVAKASVVCVVVVDCCCCCLCFWVFDFRREGANSNGAGFIMDATKEGRVIDDVVEALALVVAVAVECSCCCVNCVNCVVGSVKTSSERNVVPGEEEEDKVRCGSDCGDSTTMECR